MTLAICMTMCAIKFFEIRCFSFVSMLKKRILIKLDHDLSIVSATIHKILETNSSFYVKQRTLS